VLFDAEPARRANDDDRDPACGEILLVPQVLVGGDKHLESGDLGLLKEFAVRQRAPAKFQGSADIMIRKVSAQRRGCALIEQDAHSHGLQRVRGVLENKPGLFARDTGKPREEIRELCPVLQILEQRGDGNARAAEYPRAAYTFGIPFDSKARRPIDH
jgi:hypothetical protein